MKMSSTHNSWPLIVKVKSAQPSCSIPADVCSSNLDHTKNKKQNKENGLLEGGVRGGGHSTHTIWSIVLLWKPKCYLLLHLGRGILKQTHFTT